MKGGLYCGIKTCVNVCKNIIYRKDTAFDSNYHQLLHVCYKGLTLLWNKEIHKPSRIT